MVTRKRRKIRVYLYYGGDIMTFGYTDKEIQKVVEEWEKALGRQLTEQEMREIYKSCE